MKALWPFPRNLELTRSVFCRAQNAQREDIFVFAEDASIKTSDNGVPLAHAQKLFPQALSGVPMRDAFPFLICRSAGQDISVNAVIRDETIWLNL